MRLRRRNVVGALGALTALGSLNVPFAWSQRAADPDLILRGGKITTLDPDRPEAEAIAIADGRVRATGTSAEIMRLAGANTEVIELGGRRVIPGLNDSHTHLIRGGLNFNMEVRWENVPSVADALRMLKTQAERTPAPQWVRVVGGWSEGTVRGTWLEPQ